VCHLPSFEMWNQFALPEIILYETMLLETIGTSYS